MSFKKFSMAQATPGSDKGDDKPETATPQNAPAPDVDKPAVVTPPVKS
jgi:hypothetical protein